MFDIKYNIIKKILTQPDLDRLCFSYIKFILTRNVYYWISDRVYLLIKTNEV